jgi:hypothetical protein
MSGNRAVVLNHDRFGSYNGDDVFSDSTREAANAILD